MRLTLELKKHRNSNSDFFNFKIHLSNGSEVVYDSFNFHLQKKLLTPENIANILYVKYAEVLQKGIKVAIVDNDCEENLNIKNGLFLLKKIFPKNQFVMTSKEIPIKENAISFKISKVLEQAKEIKSKSEVVYIEEIYLKVEKKVGYYISHYKNGHLVDQKSELFNRGVSIPLKDRLTKLDLMLENVSSEAEVFLSAVNHSHFNSYNQIIKHLNHKFEKKVKKENKLIHYKSHKRKIAKDKYQDYLLKLNKELTDKNNVVVFTDGGQKNSLGMSTYIIINENKVENESLVSGKLESSFNEPIAMLAAVKFSPTK